MKVRTLIVTHEATVVTVDMAVLVMLVTVILAGKEGRLIWRWLINEKCAKHVSHLAKLGLNRSIGKMLLSDGILTFLERFRELMHAGTFSHGNPQEEENRKERRGRKKKKMGQ